MLRSVCDRCRSAVALLGEEVLQRPSGSVTVVLIECQVPSVRRESVTETPAAGRPSAVSRMCVEMPI